MLENSLSENTFDDEDFTKEFGDQACFVLMLLGKIAVKTERKARATDAWKKALKLNPFLWSCFEELCKIGDQPNPHNLFQINNMENISMCQGNSINNVENVIITNNAPNMDPPDLFLTTPPQILGSFNTLNVNKAFNKPLFTPEDSPLAQPLCLSGFWPLSTAKYKSLKSRWESNSAVSLSKEFLIINLKIHLEWLLFL